MAKMSWINRNDRKRATVKKYAALRAELKGKKDYAGLAQLPRDASPTRVVNRCEVSGRRRGMSSQGIRSSCAAAIRNAGDTAGSA